MKLKGLLAYIVFRKNDEEQKIVGVNNVKQSGVNIYVLEMKMFAV